MCSVGEVMVVLLLCTVTSVAGGWRKPAGCRSHSTVGFFSMNFAVHGYTDSDIQEMH